MKEPETSLGLLDDASWVRKQPPWLIPQGDILPTAQLCVGAEPREVHHWFICVCFLQPHLLCIRVLLHAHTDTVGFTVAGETHHHAPAFEFTQSKNIATLADPFLEVCRGHPLKSFFGEALEVVRVHEFLVKRDTRVAHNC
jgi:hypothetical protein